MSLTDQELIELLRDLESDRVERKASLSDKGKICEAICAFANDLPDHRKPGAIFIGVNDDGCCSGLEITDSLLIELGNFRADGNILPLPTMYVEKRTIKNCEFAVVTVEPSQFTPVRYRGRIWIRIGPRREIASAEDERRLNEKRRAFDPSFELRPIHSADLDILDLDYFRNSYLPNAFAPEVLAANSRDNSQQLQTLKFAVETEDGLRPTVLGLLTLGKDVRYYLPGAYIQFNRFDGVEFGDPIKDAQEISGRIEEVIDRLDKILKINIATAIDLTSSSREIRSPDYPLEALQQITRNAVMHRDYEGGNVSVFVRWFSDRVEIQSPGGPFGEVRVDNFGIPGVVSYRNRNLADVMKTLGLVQRFGVGILAAKRALAENGNPDIEFIVDRGYVDAIIRSAT